LLIIRKKNISVFLRINYTSLATFAYHPTIRLKEEDSKVANE